MNESKFSFKFTYKKRYKIYLIIIIIFLQYHQNFSSAKSYLSISPNETVGIENLELMKIPLLLDKTNVQFLWTNPQDMFISHEYIKKERIHSIASKIKLWSVTVILVYWYVWWDKYKSFKHWLIDA